MQLIKYQSKEICMRCGRQARHRAPSPATSARHRARRASVPVPHESYERMCNVSARTNSESTYTRQRGREKHARTIRRSGAARPSRQERRPPTRPSPLWSRNPGMLRFRPPIGRAPSWTIRRARPGASRRGPGTRPTPRRNPARELVKKAVEITRLHPVARARR